MKVEDFITYEQSIKLRKLGFRERCLFYYDKKEIQFYSIRPVYVKYTFDNIGCNFNEDDKCYIYYDAPTLAQVQKWLRDRIGYSINVMSCDRDCWFFVIVDFNNEKEFNNATPFYKSYEEALSKGIDECLKLLEK